MLEHYGLPLKAELLTGSMTAKQKREAYVRIESGSSSIIIGTHALIQEKVNYRNLALVITDEQHRFGVRQRDNSQAKDLHTYSRHECNTYSQNPGIIFTEISIFRDQ